MNQYETKARRRTARSIDDAMHVFIRLRIEDWQTTKTEAARQIAHGAILAARWQQSITDEECENLLKQIDI